jgi:hypothetical protein
MPPEEKQQEESSIRDDFESAIAAVENDDEGAITTETQATADEQPITAEDLNSDDGQETAEAKAEKQVEKEAGKAVEKADDDAARRLADDEQGAASADADDKPPESWNPTAREEWTKLPDAVKQQVAKRESEINKALNEGAEHRKTGAAFQGVADKYAQIFAAEGAPDPITGIEELIKTVTTLRMGSAQQKVAKVAGFIQEYSIDISMLDDALSGKVAAPTADDPIAKMLNERLKPMDDMLEKMNQNQRSAQFQRNQDAISEVATFRDGKEFYDDVKNDMADMVEMAEKRGITMPLQEAYDKACALNPEISGVLSKRAEDEALLGKGAILDAKRGASVSLSGKQGGVVAPNADGMSMRDTIEAGFDAQVG